MKLEGEINYYTLAFLWESLENVEYFINNFNRLLENTKSMDKNLIGGLCYISEVKDIIIENLAEIIKKTTPREGIFDIFSSELCKQYVSDFFSKSSSDTSKISYYEIIKEIRTLRLATDDEILRLIIENIDNIIIDSGTSFPGVMEHISHLLNIASDEQIDILDTALAQNIDIIMQKYIEERNGGKTRKDNWYNFHWFDKMEKFKQEIKNLGVEFFVNFPINNTIEEYRKISEELFGIYDEKILSILEFGQYDKTKALLMETIIKELMQHSKEECTVDDIKMIGMGNFSSVYKVKDYVLKVGYLRHDNNIPNHRRILQPIIRRKFENEPQTLEKYKHKKYFVEVQNLVDIDCWEDMNTEQIDEILFKIYCDLRNNGIVWTDITPANAGKLLKDNNINYTYTDIDSVQKDIRPTREATGMDRELSQREILKKGDYVVIDTDYLEKYNEKKMKERQYTGGRIYMTYMFEDKYQKLKKETKVSRGKA